MRLDGRRPDAAPVAAITAGFTADTNSWDYSVANAALQFLGAGETITSAFNVTVDRRQRRRQQQRQPRR